MGGGAGEKRDFDTQLRYLFDPTQKTGVTEYTTSTERAHEGVAIPRIPRVDKNASDKEAVIDSTGFPPCFGMKLFGTGSQFGHVTKNECLAAFTGSQCPNRCLERGRIGIVGVINQG